MSQTAVYLDDIKGAVSGWISENSLHNSFTKIYIFGSLIHRNERHFIASGASASDIDLLAVFDDRLATAVERWDALTKLRATIGSLEHSIASLLDRGGDEPIFSMLPLTKFEVRQCIHKGHDPKLLTDNIFFDVVEDRFLESGLSFLGDFQYHYENLEPFSVMKLCQKNRNNYLAANQRSKFVQESFTDEEPLPKELMRSAAILNFFDGDREDSSRRTDLEEGAIYLVKILQSASESCDFAKNVYETVTGRQNFRAKSADLTPNDMLFLHELLYDRAKKIAIPSVRDAVREMMSED
jgi:predicted nucleotidyltransferase